MNSTCFHSLLPFIALINDKKPEGMKIMIIKKKKKSNRFCHREGMISTLKPCKKNPRNDDSSKVPITHHDTAHRYDR